MEPAPTEPEQLRQHEDRQLHGAASMEPAPTEPEQSTTAGFPALAYRASMEPAPTEPEQRDVAKRFATNPKPQWSRLRRSRNSRRSITCLTRWLTCLNGAGSDGAGTAG